MSEEIFPQNNNPDSFSLWKFFAELSKTVLIVVALVYITRGFFLQPFIVDGASMEPKLHTNDYLLVDKISYRFTQPKRGDVIVFKYPNDTSVNYVKRVIGLPGETIRIDNGKVYLINSANPQGLLLNEPYINNSALTLLSDGQTKEDFPVPADNYFVMGDNRPESSDSREWSYLPKKDVIGRVFLRAYPVEQISTFTDPTY